MDDMENKNLDEQLDLLLQNFNKLERNISEQEIIAEIIHSTFKKIHYIKSSLFFLKRELSLKLTYFMESHFEILRIGEKDISIETLVLFRRCVNWISVDISDTKARKDIYFELLEELKELKKSSSGKPSYYNKINLNTDEKAILRDARDSGLNIFIVEIKNISIEISVDDYRNLPVIHLVNQMGMIVVQTPAFSNIRNVGKEGFFSLKIVFVTDKKSLEMDSPLMSSIKPFEEDLFLSNRDYKILLVEDNPVAQLLQKSIMSSFGVCDAVSDGEKALELFSLSLQEKSSYQIVLLDLVMPGIDGSEVLKKIRTIEEKSNIRGLNRCNIIMITTTKDSSVLMDLFRAETDAYIIKPLTKDKIERELKNLKLI